MLKKILIILCLMTLSFDTNAKTIHVVVALVDNFHQGIVPVPMKIGNGNDPENNLYWGAMYGAKTFFKNSKEWKLIEENKDVSDEILRRAVFKNGNTWLVMDAYKGSKIKQATIDFFKFTSGNNGFEINAKGNAIKIGGDADFVAYVGHDGLMDFKLSDYPKGKNGKNVAVLACYSKIYFKEGLDSANADVTVWTTGKLAPEGYVLKAIVDGWTMGKTKEQIRKDTAVAYAKYQKISLKAGMGLFVSGETK